MNKKTPTLVIIKRSLIGLLCVLIGILITAQIRSIPSRVSNPIAPYSGLKETRNALYDEQVGLKGEIKTLQSQIHEAQKTLEDTTLTKQEISVLNAEKAKSGLTKLNGQGIIVFLNDSNNLNSDESIIHASDLRDVVNVLWSSGAEGISVNGQRVIASTSIDCIVNTILINNVRISNPFQVEATGDKNVLLDQVSNAGVLSSLHKRRIRNGIRFEWKANNDITLPAFDGSLERPYTK